MSLEKIMELNTVIPFHPLRDRPHLATEYEQRGGRTQEVSQEITRTLLPWAKTRVLA